MIQNILNHTLHVIQDSLNNATRKDLADMEAVEEVEREEEREARRDR